MASPKRAELVGPQSVVQLKQGVLGEKCSVTRREKGTPQSWSVGSEMNKTKQRRSACRLKVSTRLIADVSQVVCSVRDGRVQCRSTPVKLPWRVKNSVIGRQLVGHGLCGSRLG